MLACWSKFLIINSVIKILGQDDLLGLKVGSVLHHLSIKRAIQVLRINNYEPNCLRRRPSDEVLLVPTLSLFISFHRMCQYVFSNSVTF